MISARVFQKLLRNRAHRIERSVKEHVSASKSILDCGGGDMLISNLIEERSDVKAFGADVVVAKQAHPRFCVCSGEKLAFQDKSFDMVALIFVLHHTNNPEVVIEECARVSKKHILILEDIFANQLEKKMLKLFDYAGNYLIHKGMNFPYNFKSIAEWHAVFESKGLNLVKSKPIYPNNFQLTRHRMFLLEK